LLLLLLVLPAPLARARRLRALPLVPLVMTLALRVRLRRLFPRPTRRRTYLFVAPLRRLARRILSSPNPIRLILVPRGRRDDNLAHPASVYVALRDASRPEWSRHPRAP